MPTALYYSAFNQLYHTRYVPELATKIEQLSTDLDQDVQEEKKRERYTYFRRHYEKFQEVSKL